VNLSSKFEKVELYSSLSLRAHIIIKYVASNKINFIAIKASSTTSVTAQLFIRLEKSGLYLNI
jgi:hypothetical protein